MIVIALGANLPSRYGSPEETLAQAILALKERGLRVIGRSSVWLSAPVPVSDQPWYRNAVIAVDTDLSAFEVLELLHAVERAFGRVRAERNAPRVLDLDLIAYHMEIVEQDGFIVPHPRMHGRAFVLEPLAEIAPEWVHPVLGVSVGDMLKNLPEGQEIEKAEKLAA